VANADSMALLFVEDVLAAMVDDGTTNKRLLLLRNALDKEDGAKLQVDSFDSSGPALKPVPPNSNFEQAGWCFLKWKRNPDHQNSFWFCSD
jgi:hypothetical protein